MALGTFKDTVKSLDRPKGGNTQKFQGERIPFIKVVTGKTRLHPISDLHDDVDAAVPAVKLYRYYRPNPPIKLQDQTYPSYEIVYDERDDFEPKFVEDQKKAGKRINPDGFPVKGFMYVENLTALKAWKLHNAGKAITSKEFDRNPNEAVAAKAYVEQILEAKKAFEESDYTEGDYEYSGIHIYNFPVSITREISSFVRFLEEEGEDPEDIHLTDYVFALTKEGEGKETKYGFSIDYHIDELDKTLVAVSRKFAEEKELSDFEGLLERKRFKDPDELEEEVKISNVTAEEVDDDDETPTNW